MRSNTVYYFDRCYYYRIKNIYCLLNSQQRQGDDHVNAIHYFREEVCLNNVKTTFVLFHNLAYVVQVLCSMELIDAFQEIQ